MKRTALLLVALLFTHLSYSQKIESFVALNSGLFSFRGVSAQETSQINLSGNAATTGYTNNPFGAKNGLCYGVSYQVQHVSKGNFVIGIGISYENLRSRTIINSVNGYTSAGTFQNPVFGQTYLTNQFINANPYLGYRWPDELPERLCGWSERMPVQPDPVWINVPTQRVNGSILPLLCLQ